MYLDTGTSPLFMKLVATKFLAVAHRYWRLL